MLDEIAGLVSVSLDVEPEWTVAGWRVSVAAMNREPGGAPFPIRFSAMKDCIRHDVVLDMSVHPSGWIEARVTVGDHAPYSFFIERIYEELEIWPAGSPCEATDSGRMGKRCTWVQLEAAHWPDLAFLAEGSFITASPLSGAGAA